MRAIVPILFLTACTADAPIPTETALYAGQGRDRLCVAGERGGLVVYGQGATNCSARGRIEREAGRLTLIPAGDAECRIDATVEGESLRFGPRSAACAYYCGPDADYSGRAFTRQVNASPAVDFAGDPLC